MSKLKVDGYLDFINLEKLEKLNCQEKISEFSSRCFAYDVTFNLWSQRAKIVTIIEQCILTLRMQVQEILPVILAAKYYGDDLNRMKGKRYCQFISF